MWTWLSDFNLFFKFVFNWGKLLYNVLLVSDVPQCKSAVIKHTSPPFWVSLPCPTPTPLYHHRGLGWAPVLHSNFSQAVYFTYGGVYMLMLLSPFTPLSPSPLGAQVNSVHLSLHSFPANRFINNIFLDSIYMHQYTLFVFLTYFTLYRLLQPV